MRVPLIFCILFSFLLGSVAFAQTEEEISDEELYALADAASEDISNDKDALIAEADAVTDSFTPTMTQVWGFLAVFTILQLVLIGFVILSSKQVIPIMERLLWLLIVLIFSMLALPFYLYRLRNKKKHSTNE